MTPLELLQSHAGELSAQTGSVVDVVSAPPRLFVVVREVGLPDAFGVAATDVMFITDNQYPFSAMDMFWVAPEVVRRDGAVPQNADVIEEYLGQKWRRFSWHRNGVWSPAGNPLLDHYAFAEQRWVQEARAA